MVFVPPLYPYFARVYRDNLKAKLLGWNLLIGLSSIKMNMICGERSSCGEAMIMARTANVFARVEPELKEQAESVLDQLGIPMSNAVGMFLRQIVLQKGIPFEMKLPRTAPLTYGSLTKEQFDKEIEKGMSDVKAGRVYSADAIEAEMKRDFGI